MFTYIFSRVRSAAVNFRAMFSRVGASYAEEGDCVEDSPWQEADRSLTIFDFTTACGAIIFVLFLNLYY